MAGYHIKEIQKGVLGEVSKIDEEYTEFKDALEQGSVIMALIELSNLLGAIEAYTMNYYSIDINDLIIMKDITKRAFKSGQRK